MSLKQQIDVDLKTALLEGNKETTSVLRGLKSVILNEEIARGARDVGLSDDAILALCRKEAKKRDEAAELYDKAGQNERAEAERREKQIIQHYLPAAMSDELIEELITKATVKFGEVSKQTMGQIIGFVKSESQGAADGAKVAQLVQKRITQ